MKITKSKYIKLGHDVYVNSDNILYFNTSYVYVFNDPNAKIALTGDDYYTLCNALGIKQTQQTTKKPSKKVKPNSVYKEQNPEDKIDAATLQKIQESLLESLLPKFINNLTNVNNSYKEIYTRDDNYKGYRGGYID